MKEVTETNDNARGDLFRQALIFQLKLLADGFRDLVLMPVAWVATLAGLMRGGDNPAREFHQVIELGRKSEQWINLFGGHQPIEKAGQAGSIDLLLSRVEAVVRDQSKAGGMSESAARAVHSALKAVQEKAQEADQLKNSRTEPGVDS